MKRPASTAKLDPLQSYCDQVQEGLESSKAPRNRGGAETAKAMRRARLLRASCSLWVEVPPVVTKMLCAAQDARRT